MTKSGNLQQQLLAAALAVGAASGCGGSPLVDSPARAIAKARTCLAAEPPDLQGAHDFSLAAMRISPGSPEVFALAADFVLKAKDVSGDDAIALATDLAARLETLIAYQPVDQIVSARQRVSEITKDLDAQLADAGQPASAGNDPIAAVIARLKQIEKGEWPPEVRSRVLQRLREDLDAAMIEAELLKPKESKLVAEQWRQATDQLDAAETEVLTKLYSDLSKRIQEFQTGSQETLESCADQKRPRAQRFFEEIGNRLVEHQTAGQRLLAEASPFVSAEIGTSIDDSKAIEARLALLAGNRAWMHNQHALQRINYIQEQQPSPQDCLKTLAQCDERMFTPYVLERYQAEWDRRFAELSTEDERIEAAKQRLIHAEAR